MYKLLCDTPTNIKAEFEFDDEGLWSFTSLHIGREITRVLLTFPEIDTASSIAELFGGLGGNTIPFAEIFARVDTAEADPMRYNMLKHNIDLFGFENVKVYNGYYQKYIKNFIGADIIYFDPPWGSDYKRYSNLRIRIQGPPGEHSVLFESACQKVIKQCRPKYILVKVPINYDIEYLEMRIAGKMIWLKDYSRPHTQRIAIFDCRS